MLGIHEMEPETPSKFKPQNHQFFQNSRSLKFLLILLLIMVLVLGSGIFIIRFGFADLLTKNGFFYTVVLDCGSTGTRVNVYKWNVKNSDNSGSLPVLMHSYPENFGENHGCQYHCLQTVPGLDKFVGNTSGVRMALEPLIRRAEQWVPLVKHRSTPIFVLGTAGMRALSAENARKLLGFVEDVVKEHGFLYKKEWIRVLSGKEEAYYGWIGLNYKMNIFTTKSMAPTLGLLDLGGASLQVVTEVNNLRENEHTFTSKIGSFQHYVAAYSLKGFGFSKAFDKTISMLSYSQGVISNNSGGIIEVRHPCLRYDFVQNYTCPHCLGSSPSKSRSRSSDTDRTNAKSLRLVGGSNWEKCKAIAAAVAVNSSSPLLSQHEAHSNCRGFSVHGGFRKLNLTAKSHTNRVFYALSGFFVVYNKLNMSSGATFTDLKATGEKLCQNSDQNTIVYEEDCFRVAYTVSLIEDALCLGNLNISFGPEDISWTLGAALIQGEYLWVSTEDSTNAILILKKSEFMFSSPVILFVVLSCIFFVIYRSQFKIPMLGKKSGPIRASLPSYLYPKRQSS